MKLPTMPMDIFDRTLERIDENYPFSLSPKLILALLILAGVCFIVIGILFIWYKRKTTFATSLKEQKPSLNSLLPILNGTAGSQKSPPTRDEQSLPVMVPHCHHTKSNKLKMATPSATPNETKPISLKQFNRAAADLDAKGEIQLSEYQKYLFNRD